MKISDNTGPFNETFSSSVVAGLVAAALLFPSGALSADKHNKLCALLADNNTRHQVLTNKETINDINNDGVEEITKPCWGGTMNLPCWEFEKPSGTPLIIEQSGFEWKDYWTYGRERFSYEGETYILNSYDGHHEKPAYLSRVNDRNSEIVLCEFDNEETETLKAIQGKYNSDSNVCTILGRRTRSNSGEHEGVSYFRPEAKDMTIQERRDHPLRRSETSIRGFGWIDYDNDGVKNHVVELGYASGAGRGCDYLYYDEVNAEGTAYVQSERRNQFLDIQLVDLSSRHPNCGGNKNVLLTVNGRAYYEHHTDRSHAVAKIQGGKIVGICRYEKELHTRVRGEILYRRQE